MAGNAICNMENVNLSDNMSDIHTSLSRSICRSSAWKLFHVSISSFIYFYLLVISFIYIYMYGG